MTILKLFDQAFWYPLALLLDCHRQEIHRRYQAAAVLDMGVRKVVRLAALPQYVDAVVSESESPCHT